MDSTYMMNILRWMVRGLFVAMNNLYCIPTYVLWMYILGPIRVLSEEMYWKIEGQCFYWLLTMVAFWSYSAGYNIVETGDNINPIINEECMVLVNHQSTSDVPLLMAAFSTRNRLLQNLSWIMDGIFKYTNFGIVSILHGDFFIAAGRDKRDATLVLLKEYLKNVYATRSRKWIVLFPEGGFLRKRREAGHRYAKRLNLPLLNYVTLPRLGAIQAIMDTIGPLSEEDPTKSKTGSDGKLKYVIDMTIAYPKGRPLDLGSVIFGYDKACDVRMHYRVFPIESVPSDPELLQDWVYKRYIEKESLLEYYYKTGVWEPRVIGLNQSGAADNLTNLAQENDAKVETADASETNTLLESSQTLFVHSEADVKESALLPNNGSNKVGLSLQSCTTKIGLSNSLCNEKLVTRVIENQTDVEEDFTAPNGSKNVGGSQAGDSLNVSVGSQFEDGKKKKKLEEDAAVQENSSVTDKEPAFVFSEPAEVGRINHQDLLRIGVVHACFICSTVFHFYGLTWFFNVCKKLTFG